MRGSIKDQCFQFQSFISIFSLKLGLHTGILSMIPAEKDSFCTDTEDLKYTSTRSSHPWKAFTNDKFSIQ